MSKHPLSRRDHKAIGRQLSQGVPFHRALKNVQGSTRPAKGNHFHRSSSSTDGFLQQILTVAEAISGMVTAIAVLNLYATYGFGLQGTIVVFAYFLGWEFVGAVFSATGKKIPSPLRILWRILEEIVGIRFG